jgi:hypothetical protein
VSKKIQSEEVHLAIYQSIYVSIYISIYLYILIYIYAHLLADDATQVCTYSRFTALVIHTHLHSASAYVSIRQHTPACLKYSRCSALVIHTHPSHACLLQQRALSVLRYPISSIPKITSCIRQHTSAYVSIRQHTSQHEPAGHFRVSG